MHEYIVPKFPSLHLWPAREMLAERMAAEQTRWGQGSWLGAIRTPWTIWLCWLVGMMICLIILSQSTNKIGENRLRSKTRGVPNSTMGHELQPFKPKKYTDGFTDLRNLLKMDFRVSASRVRAQLSWQPFSIFPTPSDPLSSHLWILCSCL